MRASGNDNKSLLLRATYYRFANLERRPKFCNSLSIRLTCTIATSDALERQDDYFSLFALFAKKTNTWILFSNFGYSIFNHEKTNLNSLNFINSKFTEHFIKLQCIMKIKYLTLDVSLL